MDELEAALLQTLEAEGTEEVCDFLETFLSEHKPKRHIGLGMW